MRDIGKNIKQLRIEKNLTQDALAEKLFVTRQTVSNYETGKSRPDIEMLMKIAETLDTDIHTVLYGPGIPVDRKRELIKLAIFGGILLILGLALLLTRDVVEDYYYNFVLSPLVLVQGLGHPLFFFLLGWTSVMGILCLLKAKRPQFRGITACRWIILSISVVWLALVLSYIVPNVVLEMLCHDDVGFSLKYPRFIVTLVFWSNILLQKHPYLPIFLGGGLQLCGLPRRKKATPAE